MILKANKIYKGFQNLSILKGIELEIQPREIVSIVGASGAGKSTLLHILGTLDKPDSGELYIAQTRVDALGDTEMAKFRNEKLGFVFQFHNLLPEFTALENVMLPGMIAKKNQNELKQRAKYLLELLGLKDRVGHKPSEMSGGEQQRVSVARALVNQPALVFADEPSGNLDSKNAEDLHQLFFKLRDEFNQSFVIVTHNENLANLADRKLVMKDGLLA
ncbi:MAG: ABC transporter ATP-binding protein [Cytophagales bacterium]